jgi:predicted nucleic acid-binding protein
MRFLDTNVLLRHFTGDDPQKAFACYSLLQRIEHAEEVVVTSDMVIAETVFLLHSPRHYDLSRERIRELLEPLLDLRGIRLPNKALYKRTFHLYCQGKISFPDAFNAAYMQAEGLTEIYSYDTDFDQVEGIRRVEPEPQSPAS